MVPAAFALDLFDDEAWLGVVPFHMTNVGLRATPRLPWLCVSPNSMCGPTFESPIGPAWYFFSLDAARWLAVTAARAFLNLPYHSADMTLERRGDGVDYESTRRSSEHAQFKAMYEPLGAPFAPTLDSLEYFLTERYCLYHHDRRGHPYRLDIHHRPWFLQIARATITTNTMAAVNHLTLDREPALLHFARRQDVVVWAPTRLSAKRSVRNVTE